MIHLITPLFFLQSSEPHSVPVIFIFGCNLLKKQKKHLPDIALHTNPIILHFKFPVTVRLIKMGQFILGWESFACTLMHYWWGSWKISASSPSQGAMITGNNFPKSQSASFSLIDSRLKSTISVSKDFLDQTCSFTSTPSLQLCNTQAESSI